MEFRIYCQRVPFGYKIDLPSIYINPAGILVISHCYFFGRNLKYCKARRTSACLSVSHLIRKHLTLVAKLIRSFRIHEIINSETQLSVRVNTASVNITYRLESLTDKLY